MVIDARCPTPGSRLWSRSTRDKASSAITSPAAHGSDPGAPPQGKRGTRDKASSAITSLATLRGDLCCCRREVHVIKPRRPSPPPRRTAAILGHLHRGTLKRGTRDKASSTITSPATFCGDLCCVREVHVIKPRQPSPPPRRTAAILAPSPSLTHSSPVPRT